MNKKTNLVFFVLLFYLTGCDSKKERYQSPDATIQSVKGPIDSDKDQIPDEEETKIGTDPYKSDTDGDEANDYDEISFGFNPMNPNEKIVNIRIDDSIPFNNNHYYWILIYIRNDKQFEKKVLSHERILTYDSHKKKLIMENSIKKSITAATAESTRRKAGDKQLEQMEKECNRLRQEKLKNPSQVNEARYSQAYSEMIRLRLQLYPDSLPSGGRNRLDEIEEKVDQLQNSLDEINR